MNYSNEQILDLINSGVEDSAVKIILRQFAQNQFTIGKRFQLFKHPDNHDESKPEKNDVIKGYFGTDKFYEVLYSGIGDPYKLENGRVINQIDVQIFN